MKYLLSLLANDSNHLEYSIVMIHNKNQVLPHQLDRKGDSKDSIQPKSIQSKGNHTS